MNVTYLCSRCREEQRAELNPPPSVFRCAACGYESAVHGDGRVGTADEGAEPVVAAEPPRPSADAASPLTQCLLCGGKELYVRKDFSQRLGLTIIAVGFLVSSYFWAVRLSFWSYFVLISTALLDAWLYWRTGNSLRCYRCQAEYRGVAGLERHDPFDLEIHERHRQLAAREAEARRVSSTP